MVRTNYNNVFKLGNREMQVMELIAQGVSNKEIKEKLCISKSTLHTYLQGIYSKMGLFLDEGDRSTSVLRVRAVLLYLEEKGRLR